MQEEKRIGGALGNASARCKDVFDVNFMAFALCIRHVLLVCR